MPSAALLVPVKRFGDAKQRLIGRLSDSQRAEFARWMAARVLRAGQGLATFVVCDDEAVAAFAAEHGAQVIEAEGFGLNGAVQHGLQHLRDLGFDITIAAHADLPFAEDFSWLTRFDGITVVADRRGDGTPVLVVPTEVDFVVSYGPGSFHRHLDQARLSGRGVRTISDKRLGFDIDIAADIDDAGLIVNDDGTTYQGRPVT